MHYQWAYTKYNCKSELHGSKFALNFTSNYHLKINFVSGIHFNIVKILKLILLDIGGNIYKSTIIEDEADVYDPHYCVNSFVFLSDQIKKILLK